MARGRPRLSLLVAVLLFGTAAAPAKTSEPPGTVQLGSLAPVLPWARVTRSQPGAWAEYALLLGGYPIAPYIRFTIVGPDVRAGSRGTWVEIWISQRPGSATQAYKLFVSSEPATPGRLLEAKVRLLGGPVRDLPPSEIPGLVPGAGGSAAATGRAIEPRLLEETTTVQTPAGSFVSRLALLDANAKLPSRAWFADAVPLFGLVRLELAKEIGLELHAFGSGGASVMDEDPPPSVEAAPY
ncbi:hypothetical protein [Vulgatibacter incomptus]|uniref:Uncharacterized protein n=1 Tax=Vulgatibacter incomptus TaxID=1391653 RepID=A0A0K1PID7_9BACT|nr:hypothetical protein [Vulgatibacter incomptus]AKU93308.1 hypothetical protein AKJ08_3695 [Vulgatibacter incomptus]